MHSLNVYSPLFFPCIPASSLLLLFYVGVKNWKHEDNHSRFSFFFWVPVEFSHHWALSPLPFLPFFLSHLHGNGVGPRSHHSDGGAHSHYRKNFFRLGFLTRGGGGFWSVRAERTRPTVFDHAGPVFFSWSLFWAVMAETFTATETNSSLQHTGSGHNETAEEISILGADEDRLDHLDYRLDYIYKQHQAMSDCRDNVLEKPYPNDGTFLRPVISLYHFLVDLIFFLQIPMMKRSTTDGGVHRFIDWLTDPLIHWSIDWLIDWLIDWSMNWLIDWLIDWWIDWLIDWLIDELIGGLVDWLIDWVTFEVLFDCEIYFFPAGIF